VCAFSATSTTTSGPCAATTGCRTLPRTRQHRTCGCSRERVRRRKDRVPRTGLRDTRRRRWRGRCLVESPDWSPMPGHPAEYDHILVGAGSAGCVLANRLSADPARRVLLLEAGPADRNPDIRVPLAWSRLLKSEVDWDCATAAEEAL